MGDEIIVAVLAFSGAVLAALIAKYGGCPLRRRRNIGSLRDEEQNTTEMNNLLDTSQLPSSDPVRTTSQLSPEEAKSQLLPLEMIRKIGPWGYPGNGDSFDHRGYDGIKTIEIFCSAAIDCIKVQYTRRGNLVWTPRVGANTTIVFVPNRKLVLEDEEYITDIVGYYGSYFGIETLIGLKFYTNMNHHPKVWGRDYAGFHDTAGGTTLELEPTRFVASGEKIVGFHGTAGKYIFSIGVYASTVVSYQIP